MVKRLIITLSGVLLMLAGLALLMGAGVYVTRAAVLDRLATDPIYLDASQLENAATFSGLSLVADIAVQQPDAPDVTLYLTMVNAGQAAPPTDEVPVANNDIETSTTSQGEPVEIGQEIVRLRIPALKIKRAVIDIGLIDGPNGTNWDTKHLFANRNRSDLVGHLEGSAYPGEGGNIVLVGHNYNFTVNGVFVNLQNLEKGDKLILTTESGLEREYQVVKVKSLPWLGGSAEEIKNHFRFLGPSDGEQLTLVTCGGANIGFFNRRVYVVAVPVN